MTERADILAETHRVPRQRIYFLDNIRVLLISLIILLHLAITYGAPGDWYVREFRFEDIPDAAKIIFIAYNGTVQAFALGFFFMLAAYFTAASLERKGKRRFIKERLLRLGVPLLAYMFVLEPVLRYFLYGSELDLLSYLWKYALSFRFSTGPMWFVSALLLFTAIYLVIEAFRSGKPSTPQETPSTVSLARLLGFTLLTGFFAFIIRLGYPADKSLPLLNFKLGYFSGYIVMFILGIAAWRTKWFDRAAEYRAWPYFLLAAFLILSLPLMFILGAGDGVESFMGGVSWQAIFYAMWEPFVCLCIVIGISSLFSRHFNGSGGLWGKLPKLEYTVYIIHPMVITAVTLLFRGLTLPPVVKFTAMSPIALAACFTASALILKIPGMKKIV